MASAAAAPASGSGGTQAAEAALAPPEPELAAAPELEEDELEEDAVYDIVDEFGARTLNAAPCFKAWSGAHEAPCARGAVRARVWRRLFVTARAVAARLTAQPRVCFPGRRRDAGLRAEVPQP